MKAKKKFNESMTVLMRLQALETEHGLDHANWLQDLVETQKRLDRIEQVLGLPHELNTVYEEEDQDDSEDEEVDEQGYVICLYSTDNDNNGDGLEIEYYLRSQPIKMQGIAKWWASEISEAEVWEDVESTQEEIEKQESKNEDWNKSLSIGFILVDSRRRHISPLYRIGGYVICDPNPAMVKGVDHYWVSPSKGTSWTGCKYKAYRFNTKKGAEDMRKRLEKEENTNFEYRGGGQLKVCRG